MREGYRPPHFGGIRGTMAKEQFEKEYTNTALELYTAGNKFTWYVGITAEERDQYGPFHRVTIINNSNSIIKMYFNHDITRSYTLSPGETRNLNGVNASFISVDNLDAVSGIAEGLISIRIANDARF